MSPASLCTGPVLLCLVRLMAPVYVRRGGVEWLRAFASQAVAPRLREPSRHVIRALGKPSVSRACPAEAVTGRWAGRDRSVSRDRSTRTSAP